MTRAYRFRNVKEGHTAIAAGDKQVTLTVPHSVWVLLESWLGTTGHMKCAHPYRPGCVYCETLKALALFTTKADVFANMTDDDRAETLRRLRGRRVV